MRNLLLRCILLGAGASAAAQPQASTVAPVDVTVTHAVDRASFDGAPERFSGRVHVDMLFNAIAPAHASGGSVTFEPGARTAWHTHPSGQTLIVTSGIGRVQAWGGLVREIRSGDVVWIPPGVKHWHGASLTMSMTHIAITEDAGGKTVDWLEPVHDDAASSARPDPRRPSAAGVSVAQASFGDVAPGLAQLTDDVLYGDVWNRPGLSKRDRSLVTVAALVAMNRPDQLGSHLLLAQRNGVTREELVETVTHLAFYSGWPNAVTAAGVMKRTFAAQDASQAPR